MSGQAAYNFKDLTGQKFNKLLVVSYAGSFISSGKKRAKWDCVCDCGKTKTVWAKSLISGKTRSCGCLKRGNPHPHWNSVSGFQRKGYGESAANKVVCQYRNQARIRNIPLEITPDEIKKLISRDCFYCGKAPANLAHGKNGSGDLPYNGIDRVDNTKGYTKENCVPSCKYCNKAKNSMPYQEFIDWIKRIIIHNPNNEFREVK